MADPKVAYSFQARFMPAIVARTKQSTLRNFRKSITPVVAGQTIQLYFGMRTKFCRKLGTATVLAIEPVTIDLVYSAVYPQALLERCKGKSRFAAIDGFNNWNDLVGWFITNHPGKTLWEGNRIFWGDTFVPASAQGV